MRRTAFTRRLLAWYETHGRKGLPWKRARDPYHIWVSEIMLQQTQVSTVIPYFERFVQRFPDVSSLADAALDEVLHHWTGLGYYARARNLHRTAKLMMESHDGKFPDDFGVACALPGIGPSTAGAILAFAYGVRHVVLDGNVKRVLSRYHAIAGWPGQREIEKQLWTFADRHTSSERVDDYAQAIMDLGAIVCRRANPDCGRCPVRASCAALKNGNPSAYPTSAPRRQSPLRTVTMLMIRDQAGRVLMQRRPPVGLWGGLWGFPECTVDDLPGWCRDALGLNVEVGRAWPAMRHAFSHFRLEITPVPARATGANGQAMESTEMLWYNLARPDERGFAAPVKQLIERLRQAT